MFRDFRVIRLIHLEREAFNSMIKITIHRKRHQTSSTDIGTEAPRPFKRQTCVEVILNQTLYKM